MAKRPCARPGCQNLVQRGYCEACKSKSPQARYEKDRGSAHARLYTRAWAKASKGFLRSDPICADPYDRHGGRQVPAQVTDHKQAHKGDRVLFWDRSNWQPLCTGCNSYKAVREEGGFGRG